MNKKPVVLIIFNRPNTTKIVFEKIRQYAPKTLYIIADGPRKNNKTDEVLCRETRAVINVDWECNVAYIYSVDNLGCKKRIYSGLNEVFNQVEEAIILEDDSVPSEDFFKFTEELLDKYKDDDFISGISGNNFQQRNSNYKLDDSYYFSMFIHCAGWATWKRAWTRMDIEMKKWLAYKESVQFDELSYDKFFKFYWTEIFDATYKGEIDSWAYPFLFTSWLFNSYGIIPAVNLVSNIGYDANATHTTQYDPLIANLKTLPLDFPLKHPASVRQNKEFDYYTCENIFRIGKMKEKALINQKKMLFVQHILDRKLPISFYNQDIYVFGYGQFGVLIKKILESVNIKVKAFLATQKVVDVIDEINVIDIDEVTFNSYPSTIIVSIEGIHDLEVINGLNSKFYDKDIRITSWKDIIER